MKIPMVDLKTQYLRLRDEIEVRMRDIFDSAAFVLGPNVMEFERQVAAYHEVAHAVGLASGTDALHLALRGLGVGKDDEVITTPFTFFATVEAIIYCGARPVFVDIDPVTFNMNPDLLAERITSRTKAILPVHLFGHPADMGRIVEIATAHDLAVVEDCAQAFGARIGEEKVGTFGSAGCYSFYPSKNLSGYGDGGMVVTRSHRLNERIRRLRNHGSSRTYRHTEVGYNSRLDEIQAAVLNVKLRYIDEFNNMRRQNAQLYTERLAEVSCRLPTEQPGVQHVYHQYTIRCPRRDDLAAHLRSQGISSVVYYPVPLHLQAALEYLGYKKGAFPESEQAADEVLALPMYPELPEESIERVAEVIGSFLGSDS